MCGRYYIDTNIDGIREVVEEIEKRYPGVKMRDGEVFPHDIVPIETKDGAMPARWGIPEKWAKRPLINARAETVETAKTYKEPFARKRCVIPTNGFYEWTSTPTKIKYLFELPDEDILHLASLYEYYDNEVCMVILTHEPNDSISDVHDRMPVVLADDQLTLWLNETDETRRFLEMTSPELKRHETKK